MAVPGLCDICFGEDKLAHGLEYLMHIVVAGCALRHRAAHGGVAGDLRVRRRGPPAADHRHVFLADGALRMSARHPALRRGGFILYKNTCLPLGVGHERPAQCAVKPHQLCAGAHGGHAALQISHFARELIQVEQAVDIPGRPAVG